jgi:hypothetical protein
MLSSSYEHEPLQQEIIPCLQLTFLPLVDLSLLDVLDVVTLSPLPPEIPSLEDDRYDRYMLVVPTLHLMRKRS